MLQLETIEDSYFFHSYDRDCAKIIKPNRNVFSNQVQDDDFVEISSTTLIYRDQLHTEALPERFEHFSLDSITTLKQFDADIFLIGTGAGARFPDKSVLQHIASNKLAIDFMDTGAACRTFNILTSEYRQVAALIFFQ